MPSKSNPSLIDFIIVFYRDKKNIKISFDVANTLYCFFSAYEKLLSTSKPDEKITVRNLVSISGYSRASFYKYFFDIYDLKETLEDLIIYHTETFSSIYYIFFTTQNEEAKQISSEQLRHYTPFLRVLLKDTEYMKRYQESLKSILNNFPPNIDENSDRNNEESRKLKELMQECFAAVNATFLTKYIENNISFETMIQCMGIVYNMFFDMYMRMLK